jgi:hypothetical protein
MCGMMIDSPTYKLLLASLKKWWRPERNFAILWLNLLKLILVLPVATATVERCFSAMKVVKTYLRNRISDQHLSHMLIGYVEKEEMRKVTNQAVVDRFMKMTE